MTNNSFTFNTVDTSFTTGLPTQTQTPPMLTSRSVISSRITALRRTRGITFHVVFEKVLQHMVDTGHAETENWIPPLYRGSHEDVMWTISVLHGVRLKVLMTRTPRRSQNPQLGGHLFKLTLQIVDIYIPFTKSAFHRRHFGILLTCYTLQSAHIFCRRFYCQGDSRSNIQSWQERWSPTPPSKATACWKDCSL